VSIARWNLKEAGGKALARRTGIVYKAAALDERAHRLKVQYLYGKRGIDTAGISVKVSVHYPGRSQDLSSSLGLLSSRGDGKSLEKSAEGIVGS
jgi:hypothetical protein